MPQGAPSGPDHGEPGRVADAVAALHLSYAVVTSVTRDDLPDGGAGIFAETIRSIREKSPGCRWRCLSRSSGSLRVPRHRSRRFPDVLNHNLETVPSLYPRVRPQADYGRSRELLKQARLSGAVTKSGLMLGPGESLSEVRVVMNDLRLTGCEILTLGQYLQPNKRALSVEKYYHPDEFAQLKTKRWAWGSGRW